MKSALQQSRSVLVFALALRCACVAHAAELHISITRVEGDFVSMGTPVISDGVITFRALGEGREGIYATREDGPLLSIADRETVVPGSRDETFAGFGDNPHASEQRIIFSAATDDDIQGIFRYSRGQLRSLVNSHTLVPGKDVAFASFGQPSMDTVHIAFVGVYEGGRGVYRIANNRLFEIASSDTIMPQGNEAFRSFGHPHVGGGSVVFHGGGWDNDGIYLFNTAGFRVVADRNRPVPKGMGNFQKFSDPVVDGGYVAFEGKGGGRTGIYLYLNGEISIVADDLTEAPGATANFSGFDSPSVDGGDVAFIGKVSTQHGIYLYTRGTIYKIVDLYDELEGQRITHLAMSRQGLRDGVIVFRAQWDNGRWGIFKAQIGDPSLNVREGDR